MAALLTGVIVIVLVLTMTHEGHVIDAATQHFMLYYAGVFALIGLTASVGVGLVATDRIIMTPGHRVMAQAIHRAVSFGALAFLIIHILTEILAQRVHVIDSVVPFLSPFRTFYIGLGTIASDLIVLLVITSIVRKRFTGHGKAWQWRAIHYSAYASFVFGILHGLLGGRSGKPYVDWSYGACIALVAAGLTVRFLALSLRPKETLSAPPAGGKDGGTSPMQAAATLAMAQAQFGGTVQALPASGTGSWTATALPAAPYGATPYGATAALQLPAGSGYGDGGYAPLGAPPYGDDMPAYAPAPDGYPYQPALASLPGSTGDGRQPLYEPGYVGPPRFQGAPRPDAAPDAWYAPGSGPMPRALPAPVAGPPPQYNSGPLPRYNSGRCRGTTAARRPAITPDITAVRCLVPLPVRCHGLPVRCRP
jgi:DMSO/TMAO reductase YedYZ heme-binding membrane subunit